MFYWGHTEGVSGQQSQDVPHSHTVALSAGQAGNKLKSPSLEFINLELPHLSLYLARGGQWLLSPPA